MQNQKVEALLRQNQEVIDKVNQKVEALLRQNQEVIDKVNQKVEAGLRRNQKVIDKVDKVNQKVIDKVDKVNQKVIDARLRRKADRQGLILHKSPRRTPDAIDYGLFSLCDVPTGVTIHPEGPISPYALTLEDVEEYLKR